MGGDAALAAADVAFTEAVAACDDIAARIQKKMDGSKARFNWSSNRASGLGDPCLRRIVLFRTRGAEAAPFPDRAVAAMGRGRLLEGPVCRYLEELGIELIEGGVPLARNDYQIGTRLDRVLIWNGKRYVFELKTMVGHLFNTINCAQDLKDNRSPYVRRYYDQIQPYILLGSNDVVAKLEPAGVFFLYDVAGGRMKAIPIPLDYDRGEHLLDRAEESNGHVAAGTLPDYLTTGNAIEDATVCLRCDFFGRSCFPKLAIGDGTSFFGDAIAEAIDLVMDDELKENAARRAKAQSFLAGTKDQPGPLRGVTFGIAGNWLITGKQQANGWRSTYEPLDKPAIDAVKATTETI